MTDQVEMLSTGWERGVPVEDSLARRFVFAYADRITEMARRTGGRAAEHDGARMADPAGGEPVATAGCAVHHGVVEVDWVAVLSDARGRGYGGAVTSAATAVAPELPAMLISSDDGHPVYRRLGFWDLFRTTMWEQHPPR